jgi:hypothetical protein
VEQSGCSEWAFQRAMSLLRSAGANLREVQNGQDEFRHGRLTSPVLSCAKDSVTHFDHQQMGSGCGSAPMPGNPYRDPESQSCAGANDPNSQHRQNGRPRGSFRWIVNRHLRVRTAYTQTFRAGVAGHDLFPLRVHVGGRTHRWHDPPHFFAASEALV